MDLTVVATPVYFGSMAVEHLLLRRRATAVGPTAADYTREDTLASLSMGVGSLLVLAQQRLLRRLVPGRTRAGTALVAVAAATAVATTVADRRNRRRAAGPSDGGDEPADRWSRQVSRVGGVTAVGTGTLAVMATTYHLSTAKRQWRKGQHRDLGTGVAAWAVALVGWDLIYYLNHRLMHEVRALWAVHVVHHSSERLNLSTALRQPVAGALGVWVPYGALARLGVRPKLIEHARAINLLYQFWIHTEIIGSIGRAEEVLNSPSHHRVHHGSNPRYLDRNHAGILILWDRLGGTFQREDPDDPPVYGLTRNIETFNPVRIVVHEYVDMARDIAASTTWRERLSFVVRGPGWAYRRRAEREAAAAAGATGDQGG
jgi:sterol desaturase/sphingolipid hydroxylase (fatty acid hydroxylase superfamily)